MPDNDGNSNSPYKLNIRVAKCKSLANWRTPLSIAVGQKIVQRISPQMATNASNVEHLPQMLKADKELPPTEGNTARTAEYMQEVRQLDEFIDDLCADLDDYDSADNSEDQLDDEQRSPEPLKPKKTAKKVKQNPRKLNIPLTKSQEVDRADCGTVELKDPFAGRAEGILELNTEQDLSVEYSSDFEEAGPGMRAIKVVTKCNRENSGQIGRGAVFDRKHPRFASLGVERSTLRGEKRKRRSE